MSAVQEASPFVTWAEEELRRAGLFDQDSDYEGMLGDACLGLVREFSVAGHSGASAAMASAIFARLAAWKPLTPLTNDPAEWMHIEEDIAGDAITWQSRRQGSCFSQDGGKTYYDIDEPQARWRRIAELAARGLRVYRPWQFTRRHVSEESE